MPAKAGIILDSGFRRNDNDKEFSLWQSALFPFSVVAFHPFRDGCVWDAIAGGYIRLQVDYGRTIERVDVVDDDFGAFHGPDFAHGVPDEIWAPRGPSGKDSREWVGFVPARMNSQSSSFIRRVIPVEPEVNLDVRKPVQSQQSVLERGENLQHGLAGALYHLSDRLN
jgi:hypothetical protein